MYVAEYIYRGVSIQLQALHMCLEVLDVYKTRHLLVDLKIVWII